MFTHRSWSPSTSNRPCQLVNAGQEEVHSRWDGLARKENVDAIHSPCPQPSMIHPHSELIVSTMMLTLLGAVSSSIQRLSARISSTEQDKVDEVDGPMVLS